MADPLNWSEWDNWDACVTISALTGLDYGGVRNFPAGRYSYYEGQALEWQMGTRVGDYSTLIPAIQSRYGVHFRALSVGTLAAAIARPNMGLLLAGWGSIPGTGWFNPNFQQYHSVFIVDKPPGQCLLFDPMMGNMTAGQLVSTSTILAWAKGAGVNDAREIIENEFAPIAGGTENMLNQITYPWPRDFTTKGGDLTGYKYSNEPNATESFGAGSSAQSSGQVDIIPSPVGWPAGPYQWVHTGPLKGFMVANSQINLGPLPAPLSAPPLASDTTTLTTQIAALKAQVAAVEASAAVAAATYTTNAAAAKAAADTALAAAVAAALAALPSPAPSPVPVPDTTERTRWMEWYALRPKSNAKAGEFIRWYRLYPQ